MEAHSYMRSSNFKILAAIVVLLIASRAHAQNSEPPPYLNPALPAEQRAADLVHRMIVEEKVTQLTNQSRAIERLHIPAYNWWSEALHGVASSGTTEFPEPVGLASTFDTDAIHRMAIAMVLKRASSAHSLSAPATAVPRRVWTSGHRTSTFFAIRDGDAGKKLTARTRS